MYYQVYLDVLFLTNFLVDFYLIFFVKRVMKLSYTWKRTLAGALLGAAAGCAQIFLNGVPFFIRICFSYILIPVLITAAGFPKGSINCRIRQAVFLFLGNFLLGGIAFFAQYKWSTGQQKALAYAMAVSFFAEEILRKMKQHRGNIFEVKLLVSGRTICLKGLYDTGNTLVCPWNGREVHVADEAFFREYLEENEKTAELPEYRIPFSSVGKNDGLLRAVQITAMTIRGEDGNIVVKDNPLIGLGSSELFNNKPYGIILHSRSF